MVIYYILINKTTKGTKRDAKRYLCHGYCLPKMIKDLKRKYRQNIGMEVGIEKMCQANNEKRKTTNDGSNQKQSKRSEK